MHCRRLRAWSLAMLAGVGLWSMPQASAQTVDIYAFSDPVEAYPAIIGGTVLGTASNNTQRFVDPANPAGQTTPNTGPGFPIGFNFVYNGATYDRFAVGTNGWISFGNSADGTTAVTNDNTTVPLTSTLTITPNTARARVSAMGLNLRGNGSSSDLRYELVGTAPNRVLVVQWTAYERASGTIGANGDNLNFQIRINETTNVVECYYQGLAFGGTVTTEVGADVGLSGTASSQFNCRETLAPFDWNNTTASPVNTGECELSSDGNGVVTPPTVGRTFRWTPPNCLQPTATAGVVFDCANNQYSISVDITDFGTNNTSIDITTDVNGVEQTVATSGTYVIGPYALGSPVTVSLITSPEAACSINDLGTFSPSTVDCPFVVDDLNSYCQNFDTWATSISTSCTNAAPAAPEGWSHVSVPIWQADLNGTASTNTGPSSSSVGASATGDVTGTNYLYIETSSNCGPRVIQSRQMDLASPLAANGAQFSLYYHQFGNITDLGQLVVEVEDPAGSNNWVQFFATPFNTDLGDEWFWTDWIDLSGITGPVVTFRFTGTQISSANFASDIAIDDFCVRYAPACTPPVAVVDSVNFNCGAGTYNTYVSVSDLGDAATVDIVSDVNGIDHAGVGIGQYIVTVPLDIPVNITVEHDADPVCNVVLPEQLVLAAGNCPISTFPYCQGFDTWATGISTSCTIAAPPAEEGWTHTSVPIWQADAGGTASTGTGPVTDISQGTSTGNYLYVEASGACTQQRIIESPDFDVSGFGALGGEVSLYYHAWGAQIGSLTVEFEDSANPGVWNTLFITSGDQGDQWNFTNWLNLGALTGPTVKFRLVGDQVPACCSGDLAVDQFCFREALCLPPTASATTNIDCANTNWTVDVTISDLGDAASVTVVDVLNAGTPNNTVVSTVPTTLSYGPYSFDTDVVDIDVLHDTQTQCDLSLGSFNVPAPNCQPIVCGAAATNYTYCYTANDDTSWTFVGSGAGVLRLTFNRGTVESSSFDALRIYDGVDNTGTLLFGNPTNTGNLGPAGSAINNTDPDFFDVDVISTTGSLFMSFTSDGSVQCAANASYDQWDWDVVCLSCFPPLASATAVDDCGNSQFFIDVDISDLGDAPSVDITSDLNGLEQGGISATGIYQVGPYPTGSTVNLTVVHTGDSNCDLALTPVTFNCPVILTPPTCETFDGFGTCGTTCGTACVLPAASGWENDLNDGGSDWTVDAFGTSSGGTGPSDDITGGGNYLYYESSSPCSATLDSVVAYSPGYDVSGLVNDSVRADFWHHLFGPDIGTFRVEIEVPALSGNWDTVLELTGDQGDQWVNSVVDKPHTFTDVRYRVTYLHPGTGFTGDAAFDQFCVSETPDCTPPNVTASIGGDCSLGTFNVTVDVSSLGSAGSFNLVDSLYGGTQNVTPVTATGQVVLGPYTSGTDTVQVWVQTGNVLCDQDLGFFNLDPGSAVCIVCGGAIEDSTYCYVANDNQSWLYTTSGTGQLRLRFLRGTVESSSFDDITIYDGPDASAPVLFANPANTGNLGPVGSAILSTDPDFFDVDVIASGSALFMTFTSDGSVQCATSTNYDPWEWEVFCFDCTTPTATATLVQNCSSTTAEFTVDVDLTDLGDATTVDIVDDITGVVHDDVSTLQVYQMGPYADGTTVSIDVLHNDDPLCHLPLGSFTNICPPSSTCGPYTSAPNDTIDFTLNPTQDTITVSGNPGALVTDMDVVLEITHANLSDLDITLTSPLGTVVNLVNDRCGAFDNWNIRLDDEAPGQIPTTCFNDFIGVFQPTGTLATPLSLVDGEPFDGDWTLTIVDDLSGTNNGNLISWCLVPSTVVPDCPDTPSGLSLVGTSFDEATLDWTPGATNTGWSIEYGTSGFMPGTGTTVSGTYPPNPPITLTGLPSGSSLDFYLTETCLAGDAFPVGPVSGTTLLLVNTYPYCEDFDSFPSCGVGCAAVCTLPGTSGWVNLTSDDVDWATDAGGTTSGSTGPSGDNTTGSGNYLYLEASSPCFGNNFMGVLVSPAFDVSGFTNQAVVEFAYHMWDGSTAGTSMGTLEVEYQSPAGIGPWVSIFNLSGDQGNQWYDFSTPVTGLSGTVVFRVTGTIGADFYSDMAIDDFCVSESPCFLPEFTVSQNCPTSGYNPYELIVTVDNTGGVPVDISTDFGGFVGGAMAGNSYSLGSFPNATTVLVTVTDPLDPACATYTQAYTGDCSPAATDDCTLAPALTCGDVVSGSTTGLSSTLPPNACPFPGAASLGGTAWYLFNTPVDQAVTASMCNFTDYDSRLSIFQAVPDCNTLTCVSLNDNVSGCSGNSSEVEFFAAAGTDYYIVVHGVGAATGNFTLAVTCAPPCLPTTGNDNCGDAQVLNPVLSDGSGVPTVGDNTCAYPDGAPSCDIAGTIQGVWYTFNSGSSSLMQLTLLDNNEDPGYSAVGLNYVLYSGACTSAITAAGEVACAVNAGGVNTLPVLTPGEDYLLLVYNAGGIGTQGTFGVLLEFPPLNDAGIVSIDYPSGTVCTQLIEPEVTLQNFGELPLTEVTITYQIDGGTPVPYTWSGNLAYLGTESVTLPGSAVTGGFHTIDAFTSAPNSVPDEVPGNDAAPQGSFDASGQEASIVINTDNFGSETTWELYDPFLTLFASGGGYASNTTVVETLCLPVAPFANCFYFILFDSFGDGICCNYGPGSWEIRNSANEPLLGDIFHGSATAPDGTPIADGDQSPAVVTASTVYGDFTGNHVFCLPVAPITQTADIEPTECGVFTNTLQNKVYCDAVAGATDYQFQFLDPDAGFNRNIAVSGRRWVKFSEMQTSPLLPGTHYFVRARADDPSGFPGFFDDVWGSGCETGIDPTLVPGCTQLIDDPSLPTNSCGGTYVFGGSDRVWAYPVVGATSYRFRFENPGEGFIRNIARPSYICLLNWFTLPLTPAIYDVSVEVQVLGQWSGFCGASCPITIVAAPGNLAGRDLSEQTTTGVSLWPNPVRDGNVNLTIEGLTLDEQRITVDLYDMFGKRVLANSYEVSGEVFNAILEVDGLAAGIYMAHINTGEGTHIERISVQ